MPRKSIGLNAKSKAFMPKRLSRSNSVMEQPLGNIPKPDHSLKDGKIEENKEFFEESSKHIENSWIINNYFL